MKGHSVSEKNSLHNTFQSIVWLQYTKIINSIFVQLNSTDESLLFVHFVPFFCLKKSEEQQANGCFPTKRNEVFEDTEVKPK